jgi:5-(carboxyamino)imidazole ribonucleotide synthase
MMQPAAIALGVRLRVLAANMDESAAQVIPDVALGAHDDPEAVAAFARDCDVITFDHEHVPTLILERLIEQGVAVRPGPRALVHAQDKAIMRERLTAIGVPCPQWTRLGGEHEGVVAAATEFAERVGWPFILKAARGGYDGKGVWTIASADEAAELFASGTPLLAEERVPIVRELAAVVARSPYGQGAAWPVVETVQRDGICVEVIAPAPGLPDDRGEAAQALALGLAEQLGVVGVLAVELFETRDGLVVNELAMRPHNSAHWTIEGARTSQFEQHLRAVLDYPLGSTAPTAPVVVMANLLAGPVDVVPKRIDERVHHCLARWPDVKIHLYGKQFRPGRKVGHVTALGNELDEVRSRAAAAAAYLMLGER